jgi:hypothetical protein
VRYEIIRKMVYGDRCGDWLKPVEQARNVQVLSDGRLHIMQRLLSVEESL